MSASCCTVCEQDAGAFRLALRFRDAIVEHRHVRVRHEHVCLTAATGTVARLGRLDLLHVLPQRIIFRDLVHHQIAVAQNGGQQVIEVVSHAAGEKTDRFHPLGLLQ